jgi:hypothetical protein
MDSDELDMRAVFVLKKTYRSNGLKIESERTYFSETHTIMESIVLSSDKRLHLLKDDNTCASY